MKSNALFTYDIEIININDNKNSKSIYINIENGTFIKYDINKELWFLYLIKDKKKIRDKAILPKDLKIVDKATINKKDKSIFSDIKY